MTVDASKSVMITNRDATPTVHTTAAVGNGRMFEAVGYVAAVTAAAESLSTYRFCEIPSNARVSQVLLSADDFTTAGTINVGLWRTTADGGAVVDADLFASAVDMSGGPFSNLDITYESGEYTYAESDNMIWEVLGLSADPNLMYDVVAQVGTAFNGGKPMLLKVRYCL